MDTFKDFIEDFGFVMLIVFAFVVVAFLGLAFHKHSIESTCNVHISWAKAVFWNSRLARCMVTP